MTLDTPLSPVEIRILGALMEKEVTTPEQYPLSLNALVNACNQKSNRSPVLALDEGTVQEALDTLRSKHLVVEKSGFGSRVAKYRHRFCNTEFSDLKLTGQQKAILCELFLRGAQTPGELRARAGRMAAFGDVAEVEAALRAMGDREGGALVRQLPREPGKREARYIHLCGDSTPADEAAELAASGEMARAPVDGDPVRGLEQRIETLEASLEALRARVDRLEGEEQ